MPGTDPNPDKATIRPRPPGGLARLLFRHEQSGDGARRRLCWWRFGAFAIAGVLFLYAAGAAAIFACARLASGNREVRLVDVLLPSRWPNFRIAKGRHHIGTAFTMLQSGHRREALAYVRHGILRVPAHRAGRLLLVQLLVEGNRTADAQAALLDGLEFHQNDPSYLASVFRFLLHRLEDRRVIALARETLALRPPAPERDRVAALAGATACYFRGQYDQADDFLAAVPQLASSREARLLAAKCEWDRGYRELALLRLRSLDDELPQDAGVHADLLHRLRQVGAVDEARRRSLAFQIAQPDLPGPRMELLRAYHESGDSARLTREVDALLRDLGRDSAAMLALADFAANTGDAPLALRLLEHARLHRLPWEPHAFLHVEALVVGRHYREALETLRRWTREQADWAKRHAALLDSLQAVAYLGAGEVENARAFLAKFLTHPSLRADNLLALANRFVALDAADLARRTLLRAIAADPLNQAALTRLVELDLNLNRVDALPANLQLLLAMRKPSPDVLRVAHHKLGSDLFLFSPDRGPALDALRAALDAPRAAALRH